MLHTYARVSVGLTAVVSVVVLQHSSLLAQDVVHLCQAEIRHRIRSDYGPAAKVKYRGSATRSQQYNGREGVSGAATTRVSGQSGRISYQCVVFAPARQVESARYELTSGSLPPAASNPTEVDPRARLACQNLAIRAGYSSTQVYRTDPRGSEVVVSMRGTSRGQEYDVACTYTARAGTAVLTSQRQVGTGGEGNTSELFGRAREACEQEARRQTYEILGSGPAKVISGGVRHQLALRRGSNRYSHALCDYLSADGRALLAPGTLDGEGNPSEVFGRARDACEQEARRQHANPGVRPGKGYNGGCSAPARSQTREQQVLQGALRLPQRGRSGAARSRNAGRREQHVRALRPRTPGLRAGGPAPDVRDPRVRPGKGYHGWYPAPALPQTGEQSILEGALRLPQRRRSGASRSRDAGSPAGATALEVRRRSISPAGRVGSPFDVVSATTGSSARCDVDGCEEVPTHLHTMWIGTPSGLWLRRLAVHIQSTSTMCKPNKYRHLRDWMGALY